ncbi:MAG: type II secretion system secretin GspD [Bdellovibrio sp.]|nr:type II secretion system secretin GspD [Bdellovibrio sp.]
MRILIVCSFLFICLQSFAEDKKGFESGVKTFSNPNYNAFAGNQSAKPPTFFDDEDEADFDDEDFASQPQSPRGVTPRPSTPSPYSGSSPSTGSTQNLSKSSSGISMGGTNQPGGVVSGKEIEPIKIDDETGLGPGGKEVVTDFNFPDADILDIAKTLGKLTGKNFILDKDVKGRISIISNSSITVGDAWRAFLTALDINNFALLPSGKYIRIARQRDAKDKQLKTYTGDYSPDTDALITRVIPLKYLSSDEVARNFRSFMPPNARIVPYEQTNTLIVTDTGSNIAKLTKLLDVLDVEGYDAGIEVIPVKYASASELSKLIDTLIPGTAPIGGQGGAPRFGGPGGRFTARRTKEGGIINTIIADERTNTLIVHANTKGADQVRTLVSKLDQKLPATTGGGRVQVVYLQFAEAEKIANTINSLSQGPGRSGPIGLGGGGTGINPVQSNLFEGSIKVAPDAATNSLVITASPQDFITIQRVINKLDIPRDQVYAEVVIMEVNLNRDFQYGMNIASPGAAIPISFTTSNDLAEIISNPLGMKGAVIKYGTSATTSIPIGNTNFNVPNVLALIKAIQTKSNGNILATPQIIALDNSEATFETAEKIPVLTTTAVSGAVAQSTSKESVSLSITLKPQINKLANIVKLDITAKLADISARELPAQVQNLALATLERNIKTSVVVSDKDTIVLGGLIRDNTSDIVSKIPILGDIPLLGWLFRSKKTQSVKTNMLIFITPNIIRQADHIRAVLDKKLKERDEFLEANTGGSDPQSKYRDNIIKTLPDVEELKSKVRKTIPIDEDVIETQPEQKPQSALPKSTLPQQSVSQIQPPMSQVQPLVPQPVQPIDSGAHLQESLPIGSGDQPQTGTQPVPVAQPGPIAQTAPVAQPAPAPQPTAGVRSQ